MGLWNDITNPAWDLGVVVYAMDQMATAGIKAAPKGYCFGLATVWVKRRWFWTDYKYNPDTYEYYGTDPLAVDVQKLYDAEIKTNTSDVWDPVRKSFAKAGLKLNNGKSQANGQSISGSGVYNILQNGGPAAEGGNGYYVVGMRGVKGAHGIAISNGGDNWWRLFDGNYGHFAMQGNQEFYNFLIWYISSGATKYVKDYGSGWFTACAEPSL